MPEEKLKLLPTNSEDYESIYKLLGSILCEHGEPSHYLGYLESLYKAAKKSRSAEKLVPLDEEIMHKVWFEKNKTMDASVGAFIKEICARFGSVPVVPERKSDGRDS